jgi:hypothetical protein
MKINKNTRVPWLLLIAMLFASLVAEYIMIPDVPQKEFHVENTAFFYAWYGFFSCVLIILVSKILGLFLKRREDYYKEPNNDA